MYTNIKNNESIIKQAEKSQKIILDINCEQAETQKYATTFMQLSSLGQNALQTRLKYSQSLLAEGLVDFKSILTNFKQSPMQYSKMQKLLVYQYIKS